ncbi:hypothetical protein LTR70_005857 [Exophiala xenobiotica]|uniref:BHLH domain-containing protein n=1 Tax=Lithohypha guttulata TaxID=1690604 RepID=A0ABR0K922_9EURO|nr:hypothetical protein LTR24_005453 [Lithohypha guttulata]KAK5317357.1 hypothetical protein LTR70_005857 [Exophiala xenobiotica]
MQRGQEESQAWTQDLNTDSLIGGAGDDDFTKFLELGNDFTHFDSVDQQNAPSGLDTPMGRLTFTPDGQLQALTPQQHAMLQNLEMNMGGMQPHMSFPHLQQSGQPRLYQHYPDYQQMHNPYQHQVPPTPVSGEMHAAKYAPACDSAGQIIFDRQNPSFTPLVSPAQTPLENPWAMPDYVVGDDFFSPLTSPAIEAQQSYTNATSSPVDLCSEQAGTSKRPRRKLNPASRATAARSARSSPATKAMTRRRQASLSVGNKEPLSIDGPRPKHLLPNVAPSAPVSSEDSVSPEPSSESLMRPPPIPQSRTPITLRPQHQETNAPATPATLMRIPGKQAEMISTSGQVAESSEVMEDIALPAAAADLPPHILPELNTQLSPDDDQSTPTMSAKTPKLSADSTPRSTGARGSQENLPKPSRGGRGNKKRQSISQATVSPALMPKISPSISPLVPSTGPGMPILSAETSALYLASKSNYQNIIDGTHLPGVSYPDTLAENLSSKRTSHKIAEQGRRNRINLALKEIESLLPATITAAAARKEKNTAKEESCDNDKASAAAGASKASTVEMAIIYIRSLQAELQVTKDKLEAAERSLAEGNSSGSQTSGETST